MIDISNIEPPAFKNANAILQYNGMYFAWSARVSGYTSGGASPTGNSNVIDKFPFTSDGNATDVADLTTFKDDIAGQSSTESGYVSGGSAVFPGPAYLATIEKFPFASDYYAGQIGNLTLARYGPAGQSSATHGYSSAGIFAAPTATYTNTIDKFSFSSAGNATDVGDTTDIRRSSGAGQNSSTHGYFSGGGVPEKNIIDRFPFSSDSNATDVGDLTQGRYLIAGQSSDTNGYTSGGATPPVSVNTIDKFPFATNANATDVGDLIQASSGLAGQSSTSSGYASGGFSSNIIQKFPFATDANTTDVGDLTVARHRTAGQQSS